MVNIESTATIISTLFVLILFMFFGINLGMVVLERKISTASGQTFVSGLAKMLNKTENPHSYKQSRVYLVGSVVSLLAFMALLEFGYS
ncbi:hypothetical protein PI2015_3565 [Pseudoalteromonas issachenkonii]|uniref:Uncharacterized protein n=1 Tax=Pseudoalteromonas issachenkonii TaxID=152297 RepID=A0ABN5CAJ3_9GAMM|nr:hypothetical protein [Pseudoalteromonas issachenkonii]ALQ56801.1 hypothetical protein PI2015_3565 [Pseudoalteromonas issachenkonii]ATC92768.1 hypothetical protein PISS_b0663 [Pseudoalteromonas issachenkonii]